MSQKSIKKKSILIGFSTICIFLLSFMCFRTPADNNTTQNQKKDNETPLSEKQQLFEIITDITLTNEEKAEKAEKLLYTEPKTQNPSAPKNNSEFRGVNIIYP